MLGGFPPLRARKRLVQARVASSRSQKKVSAAVKPCAASRPSAWVSGNCSRSAATRWSPRRPKPNSAACLMALMVSPPAFVSVEAPVHAVRRTGFSGEIRGGGAGVDVNGVVRARHLAHGEPHGRIGNVEDNGDALGLYPLPRDVGADVGLVLVVGEYDLDRPAQHFAAVILNCHACGVDRAHTGQIRV